MVNIDGVKAVIPLPLKRAIRSLFVRRNYVLPCGRRVFVFLSADYGNIGDLAISAAQSAYLAKALPSYSVVPVPISATREVLRSIYRQITDDDIVTTIGGGNMGSLYPDIEELRQLVIRSFPRNRVICFPQTLDWDDSEESELAVNRIVRAYSAHPDLYLFARETMSFARLQAAFATRTTVKVRLAPDIVLSATGHQLGAKGTAVPRGALLCLRDDRERSLGASHREALQSALSDAGLETGATDTHVGGAKLTPERCAYLLAEKLTQFQGARLVVTDRLHGMILAALVGTPCLVFPNANHKIRQTWRDWLAKVPQVRFLLLHELQSVGAAVEELLAVPRRDPTKLIIDPVHYNGLRKALQSR